MLLYGGDAGLVAERAAQLAKRLAERDDPPGEIIRLDDASLEDDPGRIFVELQTAPMFGGRKVLRAVAGRRVTAAQLKPLVEGGDLQGFLIVEAGNLRPDDALRALFEKSPRPPPSPASRTRRATSKRVMREVFAPRQDADHAGGQGLLLARLGADRALSRARSRSSCSMRTARARSRRATSRPPSATRPSSRSTGS